MKDTDYKKWKEFGKGLSKLEGDVRELTVLVKGLRERIRALEEKADSSAVLTTSNLEEDSSCAHPNAINTSEFEDEMDKFYCPDCAEEFTKEFDKEKMLKQRYGA